MIFLLDSSTFSQLVRIHPCATAALAALDPTDRVVICSTVRGEPLWTRASAPWAATGPACESGLAALRRNHLRTGL